MPLTWTPDDVDLDDLADWYEQDTEPSSPADGDKWLDTSQDPPVWKWWDADADDGDGAWVTLGGGGGSVAVDDDGTEVTSEASRLNFVGADVTDDGGGEVTIDLSASGDGAYAETIGDGSETTFVVTHDLGTTDVHVQVWDVSGSDLTLANDAPSSVEATGDDEVTVTFGSAPDTDEYRVVVLASGGSGDSGGGGGVTVLSPADVPPDSPSSYDDEFDAESLDAAWAEVNAGSGSYFQLGDHGLEFGVDGDSTNCRPLVRACPSGDFIVTAAFHEFFNHPDGEWSGLMLCILNSAQDAADVLTVFASGANTSVEARRQSYSGLGSRQTHEQLDARIYSAPLYLRLHVYDDNGTWRRDQSWSRNGLMYRTLDSDRELEHGITPAYIGISPYDRSGGGMDALCRWFRVEEL